MKKKNSKNKIIKIALLAALLLLVVSAVLELTGVTHFIRNEQASPSVTKTTGETINYEPATEEEKNQVETSKTDDDKIKDSQNQTTPTTPSDKKVVISSAEQQSSNVVVQTQLYGIGWQNCTLTLSMGDKKVTKTSETLYQQSFSTCLGFSVPTSELSAGTWKVELSVTNSDAQKHVAASTNVKVTQ